MSLSNKLRQVFDEHGDRLPAYAWASEATRWTELVFCLLRQCVKGNSNGAREATDILAGMGLLDVNTLATLANDDARFFAQILIRCGFSNTEAKRGIGVLTSVATSVKANYSGKIQRLLRKHGEKLRDEMTATFREAGLARAELKYAVTHWLQNALSMPISLESDAVRRFCVENRVTVSQLVETADTLDVNVSLIDDLLEMMPEKKKGSRKSRRV